MGVAAGVLIAFVWAACNPLPAFAQDIGSLGQVQPVQFNAGLQVQAGFYHVSGIDPRRSPFAWTVSGTPTLTLYGVQLPFMVMLGDQQRSFQQPFNQFGVSPSYKWAKLHLGYRDVYFSRFTLAGRRALMAGMELNPGKLRFGFVYGRFSKAVEEDTTATYNPRAFISAIPQPSYLRKGYAVKLGIGKEDQYVDLVLLRARDDPGSITRPVRTVLTPGENLVIGIAAKAKLGAKLSWELDVAGSGLTRDLRSQEDPSPPGVAEAFRGLLSPRISTAWLTAADMSLNLKLRHARYKLNFRQVDPGFESMGAYYFQNDVRQVTGTAVTTLMKNKVSLNLTGGWQRNNIRNLGKSTAQRLIGNAGIAYTSGKAFSLLFNFSNFGITQQPVRTSVQDTALVRQVSRNILLQPRLHYARKNGSHTVSFTMNRFDLKDLRADISSRTSMGGTYVDLAYTRAWKQGGASVGAGPLYRSTRTAGGLMISTGFQVNAGRKWLKDKLGTRLRSTFLHDALPGNATGSNWQLAIDGDYGVSKRIAITLQALHQMNRSSDAAIPGFTEDTAILGFNIRF